MEEIIQSIKIKAKLELLQCYYVAIHDRSLNVEDIMKSIESDIQYLKGELLIIDAKKQLNQ